MTIFEIWQDMPWFAILDASAQPDVAAALGVNTSGMYAVRRREFSFCFSNSSYLLSLITNMHRHQC
jgi:hypothetical protein